MSTQYVVLNDNSVIDESALRAMMSNERSFAVTINNVVIQTLDEIDTMLKLTKVNVVIQCETLDTDYTICDTYYISKRAHAKQNRANV
jgi:hypothetical protein